MLRILGLALIVLKIFLCEDAMRYILILIMLSACVDSSLRDHLEAEADFARHQYHVEQVYTGSFEHVEDCYYADEELVCNLY
jgi:hypothetical protein